MIINQLEKGFLIFTLLMAGDIRILSEPVFKYTFYSIKIQHSELVVVLSSRKALKYRVAELAIYLYYYYPNREFIELIAFVIRQSTVLFSISVRLNFPLRQVD